MRLYKREKMLPHQQSDISQRFLPLLHEYWRQWRNGHCWNDACNHEDALVDNNQGFPHGVPILAIQVSS